MTSASSFWCHYMGNSLVLIINLFSSTTIGDENPIRTLGDYSKPSHEGYRNTIELPVGNNVGKNVTTKLCIDILMFQQHHRESLSEAWTHFKDLLRKVPHHDLDLWLQVQIFYDHTDCTTQMGIDYAAMGSLEN
ncbi:hypothetical protein Tco_0704280 [Tanacetum coccineum]|uniref:Zinc finger, CCHC-type n=1 Tax=Tanacetum coccineum TaxID=301880 RepID=A0ABQ4Y176_9ASTR